jgi:hypothetical protein
LLQNQKLKGGRLMDECILWNQIKQQFYKSCENLDRLWIKRKRSFTTELVVRGLLHFNSNRSQQSYNRMLHELTFGHSNSLAASSFCEARARFPSYLMSEIRQDVLESWDEQSPQINDWHGFRVYAVDCSKINLPRPLLKIGYKVSGSGYYPLGLASILVRVSDQMICDIRLSKFMDERNEAHEHLAYLTKLDVALYDRGFFSLALVQAHLEKGADAVFRVANGLQSSRGIKEFWDSDRFDEIITIEPSKAVMSNAQKKYSEYELKTIKLRLRFPKFTGQK